MNISKSESMYVQASSLPSLDFVFVAYIHICMHVCKQATQVFLHLFPFYSLVAFSIWFMEELRFYEDVEK